MPEQSVFNGAAAYYRVYATADGRHMMLGAFEPKFWEAFCRAAGRPDWVARHAEELPQLALIEEVKAFFSTMTQADICHRFRGVDCCLTPVLDLAQALESEHIRSRNLVRRSREGGLQALFPVLVDGQAPESREAVKSL